MGIIFFYWFCVKYGIVYIYKKIEEFMLSHMLSQQNIFFSLIISVILHEILPLCLIREFFVWLYSDLDHLIFHMISSVEIMYKAKVMKISPKIVFMFYI